ncbi:hypothetical protein M2436_007044 [Streptomyces sp. HB372]|nr:hypothetical protein [Streptomyces sp. HB372]
MCQPPYVRRRRTACTAVTIDGLSRACTMRSSRLRVTAGLAAGPLSYASPRRMLLTRPIAMAASRSCPAMSPMDRARASAESRTASYQSPPTSAAESAGW